MKKIKDIIIEQARLFREKVEYYAGSEVFAETFASGVESSESPDPLVRAIWMKDVFDRLGNLTDEAVLNRIMTDCGQNCQNTFKQFMEEARERRSKFKTEEEFLEYELNPPPGTGSRFERKGDVIYNYYTPRSYGDGMRCYCYLIGGLPEGITASKAFCQCSRAWVEKYWEGALGRPIRVELGETAITGREECEFIVYLK